MSAAHVHLPTTLREWKLLNAKIEHHFNLPTTIQMERLIWFVAISGPTAGLLYVLSAWKRWRTNGSWLVRVDEEGYFYPHTHVVIPIGAFAFTCINLAHAISVLIDCENHLHARTVALNLCSYPVLTCFGWTKIWALLYAMPPSKYRLAQVNQKIGQPTPQSMSRGFSATIFNVFIILGYLTCFVGGIPVISFAIKDSFDIAADWIKYQGLYKRLIRAFVKNRPKLALHLQTLLTLKRMSHKKDDLHKNFNDMCSLFLAVTILQTIILIWTSYRILAALYYQVAILQKAGERLRDNPTGHRPNPMAWSNTSEIDSKLKIVTVPKHEFSTRSTTTTYHATNFRPQWRDYLPTFKRGTGVSATLWRSGPFKKTQEQILDGGVNQMMFYYKQLRRYAMNTLWQTAITAAVMISYSILIALLLSSAFQNFSVLELEVTVFAWVNITWNCGPGLLLGVISCIVAFSPAPTSTREDQHYP